jgi:hypothetical protein
MKKGKKIKSMAACLLAGICSFSVAALAETDLQWYLHEIGMPEEQENTEGESEEEKPEVVIAVIDTGADISHAALKDSLWINEAELNGEASVDDDGNGYVDDVYGYNVKKNQPDVTDTDGHGTHIAGIIGMRPTEKNGSTGIFPEGKLMIIKAGDSQYGFSTENLIKALQYAEANHADIINMSLGTSYCTDELKEEIQKAAEHAVLVAAAGNNGVPTADSGFSDAVNMFPAGLSEVFGVMSFDLDGNLAYFSNWDYRQNTEVDYEIIAPGVDIYSTIPGGKYKMESGTSMSAAVVSAACGIVAQKLKENDMYSPELVKEYLLDNASETVKYTDTKGKPHGFKKLNIANALDKMESDKKLLEAEEEAKKEAEEQAQEEQNTQETIENSTKNSSIQTPKKVSYKKVGKKKIKLSWKTGQDVTGFQLVYAQKKKGTYRLVKTVKKSSCVVTKKAGFYKIRAYVKEGKEISYSKYTKALSIQ